MGVSFPLLYREPRFLGSGVGFMVAALGGAGRRSGPRAKLAINSGEKKSPGEQKLPGEAKHGENKPGVGKRRPPARSKIADKRNPA